MRVVLLSGGSGKRLWPLSNDARSKQFLKVLKNEHGKMESMVQRVWRQLKKNNLENKAIVSTSKSQMEMIYNQLNQYIPVVVEPERKDTFPAIALAAVYLYSVENCSLEEVITVLPVDPFVEDHFFANIKEMEWALNNSGADLALLGVKPTYPSEKYGYIVPSSTSPKEYLNVSKFHEKPREATAKKLIHENALWNCGVFGFRLNYIIQLLKRKNIPVQYEALLEYYSKLDANSFDYEVVEQATNIIALPYAGYWKDLGTWNTLTDEMEAKIIGNGVISENIAESNIVNELDIPIILLGVENVVVAASPDGILVTNKRSSHKIKDYLSRFPSPPKFEEYNWGWRRVLEYRGNGTKEEILTEKIHLISGKTLSNEPFNSLEVWTVTEGEGLIVKNEEMIRIYPGSSFTFTEGEEYYWKAVRDMEFVVIRTQASQMKQHDSGQGPVNSAISEYS
ncbi:sugar phosphate nucleotidyltransferase [Pontibacillus salicampi]|uniref:Sugar phosphate nucleotidyltransferase n=1 Tax=Pontibacillus salicampi TaxID=1449801 RepID=A0ABV6LTF3_9BACI